VPVAVDQHIHRVLKDEEGELFAKVLKQAGRGLEGTSQGVYVFSASGKLLAFANIAEAGAVNRLLNTALKKFDPTAIGPLEGTKGCSPFAELPVDGLVIDVTAKVLSGYEGPAVERYANSLGRDHLWLRKDEAEAIAKGVLPESVQKRLVRFHLIDNTRGEPPMWREDEIKKLEMSQRGGKLTGSIHLETKSGDRGYKADLLGFIEVKDGKVVRFDLVSKGQFWGEGNFTRNAPKGKFPFVVAFGLSNAKEAADRVPPQAARGNVKNYLR
jgi:hypothetical protein